MDPVRHRETIALWDIIPRGTPMPHRGTKSHRIPRYVARATPAAAAANAIGRPLRWNGYSASARRYLTCASASDVERVDIFGINVYRWCRRGLALQRTKQVAACTANCNVQNRLQRTALRWCNLQPVAACWPALYGYSAGAGEGWHRPNAGCAPLLRMTVSHGIDRAAWDHRAVRDIMLCGIRCPARCCVCVCI